jgi:dTDP-glucose pyrophosphorylase
MKNYSYKKHFLKIGSTIQEALALLNVLAKDAIVFIVSADNKLIGSLTDGDVRRGLLAGYKIDQVVDGIINFSPHYLRKGAADIEKVIEYRENNFQIIPILDKNDSIVNVINFRKIKSYLPVDAVIMAGGRGERLRPLTDTIPKSLLKVGDKPIMEHNFDRLTSYGIDDFWISIKYLGEQIEAYFENGRNKNVIVQFVKEDDPLGTIGAVSKIKDFQHKYILITNSDLLTNLNYEHFFLSFLKQGADLAVLTIPYHVSVPYAVLEASNGHIINFEEKPTYTYYSNGGIYLLKRSIIDVIPKESLYNATDLMRDLIKQNKKIISYPLQGYWLDIGSHKDYAKAQQDIKNIDLN